MLDLLDASVWLSLSAPDHAHHGRARRYWEQEAAGRVAFCRITALTLLRHLSNPRVLGAAALDGAAAWRAMALWLALPEAVMLSSICLTAHRGRISLRPSRAADLPIVRNRSPPSPSPLPRIARSAGSPTSPSSYSRTVILM